MFARSRITQHSPERLVLSHGALTVELAPALGSERTPVAASGGTAVGRIALADQRRTTIAFKVVGRRGSVKLHYEALAVFARAGGAAELVGVVGEFTFGADFTVVPTAAGDAAVLTITNSNAAACTVVAHAAIETEEEP